MNLPKNRWLAVIFVVLLGVAGVIVLLSPTQQPASEESQQVAEDESAEISSDKAPVAPSTDYGGMLLKMIVSVVLVCLLAYAILRWGLSRVVGGNQTNEQMEVLGRLAIGPNRTILVVRVGPRFLVVGSGETGISILSELSEQEAAEYFEPQLTEE